MKIVLWVYAIVGSLYAVMYLTGTEVVVRYAVGPMWLIMMAAPVTLFLLTALPVMRRMGQFLP